MTKPLALIVEDDPHFVRIFRVALEKAEYEIATAADGQQALRYLSEHVPDLILLDIHLPHVSGVKVLTEIQIDKNLDQTVVIVITADGTFTRYNWKRANLTLLKTIGFKKLLEILLQVKKEYNH